MSFVRPDGRRFVRVHELDDLPEGELYCSVDEADAEALALCERYGFAVSRREGRYLLPTAAPAAATPDGIELVTADEVDEERHRLLDDALRQDVPGTDGWRWDEGGFRDQFDEAYDPATYLIALDRATGDHVGLVRVWQNPSGPRLGMIGVLPAWRRRGVGRALLAAAFAVLRDRGVAEISTEIADENEPAKALLLGWGARRAGGTVELVRR